MPSVHYLKISVLKRNPLQTDGRHTNPADSTNDLLKRRLLRKKAANPPRILPHPQANFAARARANSGLDASTKAMAFAGTDDSSSGMDTDPGKGVLIHRADAW